MTPKACKNFKTSLVLILFFLIAFSIQAQNSIQGKITDKVTQEPVSFANIFFANTSIGTGSLENGNYFFKNFPLGKYDLIVSSVGYNTFTATIDFSTQQMLKLDIELEPISTQLNEIFVKADTTNWKQNFKQFNYYFIGQTSNASKCTIKNPRDIYLYFDPEDRILVAHAKTPIVVENRALGYRIHYVLELFEMDYRKGRLNNFGIPRFEELVPKNEAERKRWVRERERTYNGSFTHFMRALKMNKLTDEGFIVNEYFLDPNPDRPDSHWLNERIKFWREKHRTEKASTVVNINDISDSLAYYLRLTQIPEHIPRVGKQIITGEELFSENPDIVTYSGMLQIVYTKEKEQPNYVIYAKKSVAELQKSIVHFNGKEVRIYNNGYYEDVRDIFLEEYLAWSEKISEILPLEYKPPIINKK